MWLRCSVGLYLILKMCEFICRRAQICICKQQSRQICNSHVHVEDIGSAVVPCELGTLMDEEVRAPLLGEVMKAASYAVNSGNWVSQWSEVMKLMASFSVDGTQWALLSKGLCKYHSWTKAGKLHHLIHPLSSCQECYFHPWIQNCLTDKQLIHFWQNNVL